jgi:hypothetical protein
MRYVNTHIHSPFSFCPFDTIGQAVKFAAEENVSVLGINDYNSTEGYDEFYRMCKQYHVYPIFGIELLTFSPEDKYKGLRWNNPLFPGMMYLCGKGLKYPALFPTDVKNSIASVWKSTQDRIWKMILKANDFLRSNDFDISLDYNSVRKSYAQTSVYERHLSKALYLEFVKKWNTSDDLTREFKRLFKDQTFAIDVADSVALQNEICKKLMEVGGAVYIEAQESSFLTFREARSLILAAGGIPCYPILLDETQGLTECEASCEKLQGELINKGLYSIEFISNRVSLNTLKQYARYFSLNGFIVTFGTDHNTSEQMSLVPTAYGNYQLDEDLMQMSYQGACMIAAHQEMNRRGLPGFVNEKGVRLVSNTQFKDFVRTGEEVIKKQVFY